MKQLIRLTIMLFFINQSGAITLDELAAQTAKQPLVRADFQQIRQISGLSKPLQSSGKMIIAKDHGLYWHQQQPFELTLVLTKDKMIQRVSGQVPQVITAENNPQMFQFNHLLAAIFNADKHILEKNFSIALSTREQGQWRLTLKPIVSPLDKIFSQINLTGKVYLEKIEIDDKQGDKSIINFSHQATSPSLSKEELTYFLP